MTPEDYGLDSAHYRLEGMTLVELSPTHCPNRHQLGPNRCLVGRDPCGCSDEHHHRTWQCTTCWAIACWPPCSERPQWTPWRGVEERNG